MNIGKYIVIEGAPGTGKTYQALALAEKLKAAGLPTKVFSERVERDGLASDAIRQMINNPNYPIDTRTEVLLYEAAHSQFLEIIKDSIANGVYCISDGNYLSTIAKNYYGRDILPDFGTVNQIVSFATSGIDSDLTIILDAPTNILRKRLSTKQKQIETSKSNTAFLEKVRAGYLWEANQRHFPVIFSVKNPEDTSNEIWSLVKPIVAKRRTSKALGQSLSSIKDIINEKVYGSDKKALISDEKTSVYNIELSDTVAVFSGKLDQRLKFSILDKIKSSDFNIKTLPSLLKEAHLVIDKKTSQTSASQDEDLDSMISQCVFVEGASNLLTEKLQMYPCTEQVSLDDLDKKDADGHYLYVVPKNLDQKVRNIYITKLNQVFSIFSEISKELYHYNLENSKQIGSKDSEKWRKQIRIDTLNSLKAALPVALKQSSLITSSPSDVQNLIIDLNSNELTEFRVLGSKILECSRKVLPEFYNRPDVVEKGKNATAYKVDTSLKINELSSTVLTNKYDDVSEDVKLINYLPRNEITLVPDMLYERVNKPKTEIRNEVEGWSYKKKLDVFKTFIGERLSRDDTPNHALTEAAYEWEITSSYEVFRELQKSKLINSWSRQNLTPRYGYDVPKVIDQANLTDKYQECFSISLELYSILQEAGYHQEAQYATLLGHKTRWQTKCDAYQAFSLFEFGLRPGQESIYQNVLWKMYEKLSLAHPLIGEAMRFVEKNDEPRLSKRAQDRFSRLKKLNQL